MSKKLEIIVFIILCLIKSNISFAVTWPSEPIPIDGGGLGILIAAGITYAIKKLYDNRKKQ